MKTGKYGQFFGKNSHLTGEAVSLYVDALKLGRVDNLPPIMLHHVEGCQYCKEEITGLFSLLVEEDYSNTGPHPFLDTVAGTTRKQDFSIMKIAATIVAVVGVGLLGYMSLFRTSPNTSAFHPPISTIGVDTGLVKIPVNENPRRRPDGESLIAARFTESPELEDLLRSPARSAETEVQSPANGSTLRRGSVFKWVTPALPPFDITILDNRRQVVRSFQLDTNAFGLEDSLQGGLYYWKLGAEGNLLHTGKFIVR